MNTIFLIGYMGSGKSTLGHALARRCDVNFIDLDDYIEAKAGQSVREIFASRGEEGFRALEREALLEVSRMDNALVACGGGTPCFQDNMELMNSRGTTVFLSTSHSRLLSRLKLGRDSRPLIAALSDDELSRFIAEKLRERLPHYSKASATFDSTLLEDEMQVEHSCRLFISQFNLPLRPSPKGCL